MDRQISDYRMVDGIKTDGWTIIPLIHSAFSLSPKPTHKSLDIGLRPMLLNILHIEHVILSMWDNGQLEN